MRTGGRRNRVERGPLKNELGSQLEDSARSCGNYLAILRVVRVVIHRTRYTRACEWVISVLSVIENVERLGPELEPDSLRNTERLPQTNVPIVDARLPQNIAAATRKLAGEGLREGRCVEPFVYALLESARIRLPNLVGSLRE